MRNYDDIKGLTRPQYADLPPMSMHDRAAQFAPFAALVGYDDAVAETARRTDARREMLEDEINELNAMLKLLAQRIGSRPLIRVTYFVPDARKSGGSYTGKTGNARVLDPVSNVIVFTDGETVSIKDMYSLVFVNRT